MHSGFKQKNVSGTSKAGYGERKKRDMQKVDIAEKLAAIDAYWDPRIVGKLNGQLVKLVKISGAFTWHSHENEDELFLVIHGGFRMELRDKNIDLREGEFLIVPRGVEHRPVSDGEAHVLLFEPASTLNPGNVENAFTRTQLKMI